MKALMLEEKFLIDLYNQQPVHAESLGGTKELVSITKAFNKEYKVKNTQTQIQAWLIALRKLGALENKTLRGTAPPVAPTWPQPRECKNGVYEIPLTVRIDGNKAIFIIQLMIQEGKKPVSRKEVYDWLQANPVRGIRAKYLIRSITDEAHKIFEQLFPEMILS